MLRRFALITLLLAAAPGAAHGAAFVNPVVALPGAGTSCSQLEVSERLPAIAGSASGRAVVAALAPDCSVAVALRSSGSTFGPSRVVGGQVATGTETIDAPKALVNARGDAVVAWQTPQGCNVAYAPAGSDTIGAADPPGSLGEACAVARDGAGRVTIPRNGALVDRAANGVYGPLALALPAPDAQVVALAANEAGDTVAIAASPAGPGLRSLDMAIRPGGGTWGGFTHHLATATAYRSLRSQRYVSLAVDAAGRITAVWPDQVANTLIINSLGPTGVLMAATGTVAGGMGAASPLPAPGRALVEARRGYLFSANARGDVAVAFAAIAGPLSGTFVLTERPAGSPGFGPPTILGTVRVTKLLGAYSRFAAATVPIAVALAADGSFEVVQGIEDVGVSFLQARVRPAGGRLGRPFWLTPPQGTGQLFRNPTEVVASAGPAGTPLVAWRGAGPKVSSILTSPNSPPPAVATAGGPPPLTFKVLKVTIRAAYNGARYVPSMRITVRASRPTLGSVVILGRSDTFTVRRAGVSTVTDSCFTCYRRPLRPGKRLRLVIDLAGAGDGKVVRTVVLPR